MNASAPQPGYIPPPPPQQGGGMGWVKWVVMGCGCIVLLFLGTCAGCYFLAKRVGNEIKEQGQAMDKAWSELGEKNIKGNAVVEKALGAKVRTISDGSRASHSDGLIRAYKVVSENDEEATVEIEFKNIFKPEFVAGYLYYKNKRFNITTGKESDVKTPSKPVKNTPPDEDEKR